ncbi:DNA cytosine methyltransferase [Mycolicibacterium brumae]|uniref:DNA (cytosine-5-)-methyltransferase n=1 Tax=Mycolicibacterium brumae TaxID=85968 RepID=A0A2G5P8K9_9MYCO|nr:DNA cytosine methyltransferase [Mycolicibacterium brumae]MCV7194128.1 DNA cytosine methyltransferase [Mycolicibacterium brumae]PIB74440.1 DNA cytosine methyltransferase [Mycolicibacterium brumae]RWA22700.1 hypothetical protein MBRU_12180 [Mycolicibacterium brumae DSM 44177]UWW07495.1 DNA cytosine methyltransferase [Mycolicibacterium brumae]
MILDLFSGAGGWLEGLLTLHPGTDHLGVEIDPDAVTTSRAAGHTVIAADITALDPATFGPIIGMTGSPPCQPFSVAGAGEGRAALDRVVSAVRGRLPRLDAKTRLTVEPLRWVKALTPEWICMEQVVPVLPVWRVYAERLEALGYHAVTGVLTAADYGVPQDRRRAVLIASRVGEVRLPEPTARVSMGTALGIRDDRVLRSNYSGHVAGGGRTAAERGRTIRRLDEPAVTITRRAPQWQWPDGRRVTLTPAECGVLQGFPRDYPWSGTVSAQRLQAGNAVPPGLAAPLIRAASHPVGRKPKPSMTELSVRIPSDLHKRLRLAAVEQGVSAGALAAEALSAIR